MTSAHRVAYRHLYAQIKQALSMGDAKAIFDLAPGDPVPDEDALRKLYRRLSIKHHPDRGGDHQKMVEVNVAYNILRGEADADPEPGAIYDYGYSPRPVKKEPDEIVDFDEAKSKAGIPGGVKWLFVTTTHMSGYSSDEFTNRVFGWVAVGQTDGAWVYVSAENHWKEAHVPGVTDGKKDVWYIRTHTEPKGDVVTARLLYGGVMKMWKQFKHLSKRFNSKVTPAEGWSLSEKTPTGRSLSIKNFLLNSGLLDESKLQKPRKYIIEIHLKQAGLGKEPAGYYKPRYGDAFQLTLIISGKDYVLSEAHAKRLYDLDVKGKDFMEWVFGRYYYGGETKTLTRKRGYKSVTKWMAENLTGLPEWVVEALLAVSA